MTKANIIRDLITQNTKNTSKRAIAVELYERGLYKTVEAARSGVRRVLGVSGTKNKKVLTNPEFIKFFDLPQFNKWANENLDEETQPWAEAFQIPSSIKHLNIIADIHSVHLDKNVMKQFIKQTKNKEAVILNGDLMDSESLSRHLKGHNVIAYEKELEICHQILKGLKEEFTHVYFKEGNHDYWLNRYLLNNAREVFRLLGLDMKSLLRLGELGVHHMHNLKHWKYGDLDGVHGHEFPGFGMGKFPATGLLDKWQTFKNKYEVKVISSHCHRVDYSISKKSKDGKFGYGWTTPAMCKKAAHFNPYAGWNNGWSVATINADNLTEVKHIVI